MGPGDSSASSCMFYVFGRIRSCGCHYEVSEEN